MYGVKTTNEYCEDEVKKCIEALELENIQLQLERVDRSEYDPSLFERVYFCSGECDGVRIYFLIMIDENAGVPFGNFVEMHTPEQIRKIKYQYRNSPIRMNRFFQFAIMRLGDLGSFDDPED